MEKAFVAWLKDNAPLETAAPLWFDQDDPLARSRGVPPQRAFRYKPQKQRNCNLEKLCKNMWPFIRAQRLKIEQWLRALVQKKKIDFDANEFDSQGGTASKEGQG